MIIPLKIDLGVRERSSHGQSTALALLIFILGVVPAGLSGSLVKIFQRRLFPVIWILTSNLILAACGATVEPPLPVVFSAAGSDTLVSVTRHLADSFAAQKPHISFEIEIADSNQALARLAAGEIDFALTTIQRPDLGQLEQIPIARDGIAIIVHPDNPVDNLTLRDLEQLYDGRIFNWRDVQGARGLDQAVQVVTRERGSGTGALFQERILSKRPMTPNARVFPNSQAVVNFVAQHPETVGFVSPVHLSNKVKVVSVEEILPSQQTLANAAYPLTYLLYIATPVEPNHIIHDFVEFILGPAGQSMLAANGFGRIS